MDTLPEEPESPDKTEPCLKVVVGTPVDPPSLSPLADVDRDDTSLVRCDTALSVRRPSGVVAVPSNVVAVPPGIRRGSAVVALGLPQSRYIVGLMQTNSPDVFTNPKGNPEEPIFIKKNNRQYGDDALTNVVSALYAKLIIVMGLAFPITEVLSAQVSVAFYQGFYLYLYLGSIAFMTFMYATLLKNRAVNTIIMRHGQYVVDNSFLAAKSAPSHVPIRYGSFYLRLGATAFGIGSMVYSGLEFGQFFELKRGGDCGNPLQAITPATRMLLTLLQMQFIFMNNKNMNLGQYKIIARFGLMHMIATNLCEWLYVLVEETKHEIVHLTVHGNHYGDHHSDHHDDDVSNLTEAHNISRRSAGHDHDIFECRRANIMGTLVQNASPFLFPCTIEYSLICAVILYEMWKDIKPIPKKEKLGSPQDDSCRVSKSTMEHGTSPGGGFGGAPLRSSSHLSVDCSKAHKGLFAGILVLVLAIISLILFFVMYKDPDYRAAADRQVCVTELTLYVICSTATVMCMFTMRDLTYRKKLPGSHGSGEGIGLDNTLLLMAQTGMYIYCMFSIVGSYFQQDASLRLMTDLGSLVQATLQTLLVLDAWRRRCRTLEQTRRKPGRELITFLLVANMAMWTVNTLHKGHAEYRPQHLEFFGVWAWAIITHVSMPLAIFYRFHSTICLFEVWKSAYKMKNH